MPLEHYLQLSLTPGLGPILISRLIEYTGSSASAVAATPADLRQVEGIGSARASSIHAALRAAHDDALHQLQLAREHDASLLCPEDESYPHLLRSVPDPPPILYLLGELQPRDLQALAIVGSRRCTYYGREQAERFASLLAAAGFTIVSGGARGTDSAAHRGALRHPQGRTLAVLGSGLDIPYPPENAGLFKEIAACGAVLSEFPFNTPPAPEHFPRRNRIVSGLSRGVLVIEAGKQSGALITARLANEDHNRPVFALPGRVDSDLSAGPHQLIRDGAILASCLDDILAGLDPLPHTVHQPSLPFPEPTQDATPAAPQPSPTLTPDQSLLLEHLGPDPTSVDILIDRTGLDAPTILRHLTFLTLQGLARRAPNQSYLRPR